MAPRTATVQPGGVQQVTATVENDPTNKWVQWSVSCSSTPCGSLTATSTPSGMPITYTPPVALPAAPLSVTVTATSVADSSKAASVAITVPQIPGFAGVSEAHVEKVNGIARLIIDGLPAPPLWFQCCAQLHNQFLAPQVQYPAASGVHVYSIPLNSWPWDNQNSAPLDFSVADQDIDRVLAADPSGLLVLGIAASPNAGWVPATPLTSGDYIVYPDGVSNNGDAYHISTASDSCFNGFLASVPHLLHHYESSSYAAHILGYIITWSGTGTKWKPRRPERLGDQCNEIRSGLGWDRLGSGIRACSMCNRSQGRCFESNLRRSPAYAISLHP